MGQEVSLDKWRISRLQFPEKTRANDLRQKLYAAPGKILVHRETTAEFYRYRELGAISQDAANEHVRALPTKSGNREARSPWGLVVGVGKAETTLYGTKITTDIEEGDWVCVAQVGLDVPLEAGDGTFTFVYSIPFDGVIGRLEAICEVCGHVDRKNPRQLICPKCGEGPVVASMEPTLVKPSMQALTATLASKVR